jgi:hypothetical protein
MALIRLYLITSGSCFTQSVVPTTGSPRLFDPSDIYVYRGKLLVSRDGGYTWKNITPPDVGFVSVVAQTEDTSSSEPTALDTNTVTYLEGWGSGGYIAKYQKWPEVSTWSTGSPPPTDFNPEDAAADVAGDLGVLVGNIHSGTESRIVGAFSGSPFQLVDSDTGIPQSSGSIAQITDIEICE